MVPRRRARAVSRLTSRRKANRERLTGSKVSRCPSWRLWRPTSQRWCASRVTRKLAFQLPVRAGEMPRLTRHSQWTGSRVRATPSPFTKARDIYALREFVTPASCCCRVGKCLHRVGCRHHGQFARNAHESRTPEADLRVPTLTSATTVAASAPSRGVRHAPRAIRADSQSIHVAARLDTREFEAITFTAQCLWTA
jgi:hypothetical protein